MAERKKFMIIPREKFFDYEGLLGEEIPFEEKEGKTFVKIKEIVKNPEAVERNISSYYGDVRWTKGPCKYDGEEKVYHFSEFDCLHQKEEFESHKCLCVYNGHYTWHLPGQCKHLDY